MKASEFYKENQPEHEVDAKAKEPLFKDWSDSPNVAWTKYYEDKTIMEVAFQNGSVYQYLDVPMSIWDNSIVCPSIGSFMHRNIKGVFRYSRVK